MDSSPSLDSSTTSLVQHMHSHTIVQCPKEDGYPHLKTRVSSSQEKIHCYLSLGSVDKHAISVQECLVKCLLRLLMMLKSVAKQRVKLDGCVLCRFDTSMTIEYGIV